jgi:hypothetical protein
MEYFVDAHREETRPLITSFFSIIGENLNPRECTCFLGIEPTKTSETMPKGGLLSNGKQHMKKASWSISLDKEPSWGIEDGMSKIIDTLWPHKSKIVEFLSTTKFEALFGSNVTIHASRPLYVLSPEILKRISFFGVEYGLDIFDYSD